MHVAFTPAEATAVPTGIVVDVLRASSTIVQALESGYRRVLCCAEIEQAQALREEIEDAVLAGERQALRVEGFDFGTSPQDFLEPKAAVRIARSFPTAEDAFRASVNPHNRSIEEDLVWCARENAATVAPRFVAMRGPAASC